MRTFALMENKKRSLRAPMIVAPKLETGGVAFIFLPSCVAAGTVMNAL